MRAGERTAVIWAALYFFCILCGYYILRPLRDEMGILGGVKNLKWMFSATFSVILLIVPMYSAVVARFKRRRIIPVVYRFCAINLLLFLLLDRAHASEVWVARIFFVWVSAFNVFVVSVFWSFMVDTFRTEQGKRLFGAIAAGGSVGAIAGPLIASVLVKPFGRAGLYVLSAILLEVAVWCVRRLIAWAEVHQAGAAGAAPDRPVGGGIWAGFKLALGSPYLLSIAAMMLAYSITSTFVYADQARIVEASIHDSAARTALFANIELAVNVTALVVQSVVTGWLLTGLGVGVALCVLPVLTAAGFLGLGLVPGLAMLVGVQIVRRAVQYGLERPSREVLFTAVTSEEKYKAKSFVDTVVFRGGDAAAIWVQDEVQKAAPPAVAITAAMFLVCAGWLWAVAFASRRHSHLAANRMES